MLKVVPGLVLLSVVSQAISLVALPLLTAYYSPENFNSLAAFSALATIGISVAALRLELTIPIVERDRHAVVLSCLTGGIVLTFSAVLFVVIATLAPLLPLEAGLRQSMLLIPLAVASGGIQSVALHAMVRQKRYSATGWVRIAQTLGGVGTQIAFGLLAIVEYGLIVGFLINILIGAILLIYLSSSQTVRGSIPSIKELQESWRQHRSLAKFSTIDALLNTGGIQIPLFLVSAFGGGAAGGILFMALRLFYTPSTIVSSAFAKLYHAEVGRHQREGSIATATEKFLGLLLRYGGSFVIFITVIGPVLVEKFLRNQWAETGRMLVLIAPWVLLQLLSSPISTVMYAVGAERTMMILNATGIAMRVGAVGFSIAFYPSEMAMWFAASSAVFYGICLAIFMNSANIGLTAAWRIFSRSAPWLIAAVLVSLGAKEVLHATS